MLLQANGREGYVDLSRAQDHFDLLASFSPSLPDGSVTIIDFDRDGLPYAWEQQIFDDDPYDDIETIEDVLPDDDYDGDGSTNGEEEVAGTDPTDPHSFITIIRIERTLPPLSVTISWTSVPGKHCAVYYSDVDFEDPRNWIMAEDEIAASGTGTNTWTDDGSLTVLPPEDVPERYYKVEVYPD